MNKNDLRVQKTIENIYTAFEKLINEKEYEKITVTELAQKAKINKKTFYSHYSSLDNFLQEFQEKTSSEYIKRVENLKIPEDLTKIIKEFFLFIEEKGKILEIITSNEKFSYIRQKMINKVYNATWENCNFFKNFNSYEKLIFSSFIHSATLGIYKQWIENEKQPSLEEIIEISSKLLYNGISNFENNKNTLFL